MSKDKEIYQSFLQTSKTNSVDNHYILKNVVNACLEQMISFRVKSISETTDALNYYKHQIQGLIEERIPYQEERIRIDKILDQEMRSDSIDETLMSSLSMLNTDILFKNELALKEAVHWHQVCIENNEKQFNLFVQHLRLTNVKLVHLEHNILTKLAEDETFLKTENYVQISNDIDDISYSSITTKLLDMHIEYYRYIIPDFSHDENRKNYFTIERLKYLKDKVLLGNLDFKISPDIDEYLLNLTNKTYYT